MTENKSLLLLIDGNAIIHRAFHALPPLTVVKTGEMINGVKGFAATILKVLKDIKPSYWAIAFDRPSPTFRQELFDQYKAQRAKTPPELVSQIARAHQVAEAFHIPVFEIDGYEADDVLGTLTKQAGGKGLNVLIVTGDNDMFQLISPGVRVLTPGRPATEYVSFDEAAVEQKYEVKPSQLIDLKALAGDPSDNIPGVPGIGKKTAAKLLQQFGSLENLYENLYAVAPARMQDLLQTHKDAAFQGKNLVTIVKDVPITLDLDKCKLQSYDRDAVVKLFRELSFNEMLFRLPDAVSSESVVEHEYVSNGGRYHTVTNAAQLDALAARMAAASEFAVDTETSGQQPLTADLVGISISLNEGEAFYIPVGHEASGDIAQLPLSLVKQKLSSAIGSAASAKVAQNGKFDMTVLQMAGMPLHNLTFDTMIAAYLLGDKQIGLKAMAFNRLGIEMTPITDLIGKGAKQLSMAQIDIHRASDYACADADITLRLKKPLEAELRKENLWELFNDVEMPLVPILASMEQEGVTLDLDLLAELSQSLGADIKYHEDKIYEWVGHEFNINSPLQLSQVLYDQLKLPRPRKTQSGYSTEAAVLEHMRGLHPVIEFLLHYRQLTKLKSTYVDALPALVNSRTGRIHTTFNQTGTTTGRLSSSDPNLQNIPVRGDLGGKIRQAIIARKGWTLLSADYSQIDLRALAHISQDKALIETFLRDDDVHTSTAAFIFHVQPDQVKPDMRRVAKTVNFGVIYGMSGYGLEQATGLSRDEATHFIQSYFDRYPGVKAYVEATKKQLRECGYVQTVMGRRRYIPEIGSPNRQVQESAERMAINMPVQGTSADIIKVAMINLDKAMKEQHVQSKMILQVHDELVFDVAPGEKERMRALANEIMPNALKLSVPLKIDIKMGKNWNEMN